ncbi:MAG: iron ABC transporter permease [Candidatus Methanomethylophilaceae archaeon]|jgi:iron complex transport system permease protein|nr:iron ABC transporter permease [Candidatus Methanomethylophilaceae archaeon]MBR6213972.1 iron ABC transporter permease [Candidatus Methanomethylophilaceae archaeon]
MSENKLEQDIILSQDVISSVREWNTPATEDSGLSETVSKFNSTIRRKILFIVACAVIIVLVTSFAVTVGALDIGFLEVYQIIIDHITGNVTSEYDYIVFDHRLPRVIAGILGGAGLAICGVIMQSVLKNPLADPYTTGVSSGAAFGATIGMSIGMASFLGDSALVVLAFVFSLVPTAVIAMMSRFSNASPTTVIMAGIGIMYIFNAFTTVLMLWMDSSALNKIFYWQTGSLALIDGWNSFPVMFTVVMAGIIITMLISGKLNVLATGDDSAKAMGINADRMRLLTLILTGVVSAAIVSFTGLIGFVGLVTPHIVRMFIGADNRYLVPACALFGAALMLIADIIGRVIIAPSSLPVGVVMSFIGGPVFLWMVLRRNSSAW